MMEPTGGGGRQKIEAENSMLKIVQ
jgi:hypothetical protein